VKLADIKKRTDANGRVHVYAIGDLHADARNFNEPRLRQLIAAIAADPFAVAFAVGDYLEGRIPGMRFFDPKNVRHDFLDHLGDYVNYGLDVVSDYLMPLVTAKVPLVVSQGNHDDYLDQVDFTAMLAQRLGPTVKYLGGEGLVRIRTGTERKNGGLYTTVVHASHGAGGGMRPGGKINRQQQTYEWLDGVDIVLSGHVHDSAVRIFPGIGVQSKGETIQIRERDRALYRAPAFVERAIENVESYAGRKGYGSNDRGLQFLKVVPHVSRIFRAECEF
jgi:predicted phosphodiesterase